MDDFSSRSLNREHEIFGMCLRGSDQEASCVENKVELMKLGLNRVSYSFDFNSLSHNVKHSNIVTLET